MRLYVMRHAKVVVDPAQPSAAWSLAPDANASIKRLMEPYDWSDVGQIFHSPEPKAVGTAAVVASVCGAAMHARAELREAPIASGFLTAEAFERRVASYLAGESDSGLETYVAAQGRIVACAAEIVASAGSKSAALVAHGRILTLLFSRLLGQRLGVETWRLMQMPDLSIVDLATRRIEQGFLAGREILWPIGPSHLD